MAKVEPGKFSLPEVGKKVYPELQCQRWKCQVCKPTFTRGRNLIRARSRITRRAEVEALWQLKDISFAQVTRELEKCLFSEVK